MVKVMRNGVWIEIGKGYGAPKETPPAKPIGSRDQRLLGAMRRDDFRAVDQVLDEITDEEMDADLQAYYGFGSESRLPESGYRTGFAF